MLCGTVFTTSYRGSVHLMCVQIMRASLREVGWVGMTKLRGDQFSMVCVYICVHICVMMSRVCMYIYSMSTGEGVCMCMYCVCMYVMPVCICMACCLTATALGQCAMIYYTLLHTVLRYAILCRCVYPMLCYDVLYCAMLHCTMLYCAMLFYSVLCTRAEVILVSVFQKCAAQCVCM